MYLFVDFLLGMYFLWIVLYDFICWFFIRYVLFVDCFGYDIFMVIMLNGVVVMDVVLLLIGNNILFVIFNIFYLKNIYKLVFKKFI